MPATITVVVEGPSDLAILKRLCRDAGLSISHQYGQQGKSRIDINLARYNHAARFSRWLVLRDLDHDAACAPELRRRLLPAPAAGMRLHIAVRAIEAWLLADAERIAEMLSVRRGLVPPDPDALDDPKKSMLDLARQSRRSEIRKAMLPAPGTTARVGRGYTTTLVEFATDRWRPQVAATRSASLARLLAFLKRASKENARCSTRSRTRNASSATSSATSSRRTPLPIGDFSTRCGGSSTSKRRARRRS
jgi:hypothetical protein